MIVIKGYLDFYIRKLALIDHKYNFYDMIVHPYSNCKLMPFLYLTFKNILIKV